MTRLLFDTTFLIDAERAEGLDEVVGDDDDVAIAAVTLAVLRVGALLADARRRAQRTAFVDDVAAVMPVVTYDIGVAEDHAVLLAEVQRQGRPRGAHDLMIAATARRTGRTVVTSDVSAFADLPGIAVSTRG